MERALRTILLSLVVGLVFFSAAFPQTLEELLEERKKVEKEAETAPRITPLGVKEKEKPEIPLGIPVTEEKTTFDRKIDPKEYTLGPGDEFTIYLWGQLDTPQTLIVNPEGKLLVPYVGPIEVSGMTLAEAKELIIQRVKERYPGVDVSVELSNLRKFRLFVAGRVARPGSYTAYAVDRVFDVIEKAGGLAKGASKRNIKVYRQNGEILDVDLDRFLKLGYLEANPYVKMGDVISVPVAERSVSILGAVNSPGAYELRPGETIKDLIVLAEGVWDNAKLDSVELVRFKEDGIEKKRLFIDLTELSNKNRTDEQHPLNSPLSSDLNITLKDDDMIFIRAIPEWHVRRTVGVYGEVKYPGIYAIEKEKTKLSQIIKQAGGFTPDAFLHEAKVIRTTWREMVDPEFKRLQKMRYEDMTDMEKDYFNTKLREIKGSIIVNFEKLFCEGDSTYDIILRENDIVWIPKKINMVSVSGKVVKPGLIPFYPDREPKYYIKRAEGYTWNANKGKTQVIKGDTGAWLKMKKVKTVNPGDEIWIPKKPEHDWWRTIRETTAFLANTAMTVATIYIAVHTAFR